VRSGYLTTLGDRCPRLERVWVEGGFQGQAFAERIFAQTGIRLEVVKRSDDSHGFVLLPKRWIVERTFAWFYNYCRLSKDYEYWVYASDSMIYAAMVHLMLRRLARLLHPT
jgi:putative transposase